ncbi:histidine kinase [Chitinophaga skermanii]|uniref:Histidine kinase n=1 Tax=Chitinophaga skermanii TaxID=331697 RepID=A0A327QYK0_9BACT|nr:sensor histidine kinase [Chitinophaga skermanii]RAJ08838.1 histidine kinase [Chitinophaga skermanii]
MKKWYHQYFRGVKPLMTYEILVWLVYVCIYKWATFAEETHVPRLRTNFPMPELILYAIGTTLYIIPYYRWIGAKLLEKRRFVWLFFVTILYFWFVPKYCSYVVASVFQAVSHNPLTIPFYNSQVRMFERLIFAPQLQLQFLLTDMMAFFSVMFMRYATQNERKRSNLEKEHLALQLDTLKAQLHPHFLFNTLNSIYGMSITGAKDTPAYILKLSDMMRYILYDCRHHAVDLEKDIAFLDNYMQMEQKRYPAAHIDFQMPATPIPAISIAPLMLIPFMENVFKHGAHRVVDDAFIRGELVVNEEELVFELENSVMPVTPMQRGPYGGVGIENVKKRLALYYPNRHRLQIEQTDTIYSVHLTIQLKA